MLSDNIGVPSSFCTICTNKCKQELVLFLLTLSIHHNRAKVYILCDTETKKEIDNLSPDMNEQLDIHWFVELDKYSNKSRIRLEKEGIWDEFQALKMDIMLKALKNEKDTLLLDSDIVILDKIDGIDHTKEIGVSPQFIKNEVVKYVGYYNGGMLWTKNKNVVLDWIKYTKVSRYFDQASIEDLVKKYTYFEFGENYNLHSWRFILGIEDKETITNNLIPSSNKLFYKDKPLKSIHNHFNVIAHIPFTRSFFKSYIKFKKINNIFISKLIQAKCYKELSCIYRSLKNKWIIKLPKQFFFYRKNYLKKIWYYKIFGMRFHTNDSFRELAPIYGEKIKDVHIIRRILMNCWLFSHIVLYDRPQLNWVDKKERNSDLLLLGNGDINKEGVLLKQKGMNIKPWIFWPRHPKLLERMLEEHKLLEWEQRECESIFIGNIENDIQGKYREEGKIKWEGVLQEYHCTKGTKKKFTQEEYMHKLRKSKYGLCLRGYGSKCHREVECMAWGTVPLITKEVSIQSYLNPPREGIHYIFVDSPEDLLRKLKNINKQQWTKMSKATAEWYRENVHSDNSWNTTIKGILYQ